MLNQVDLQVLAKKPNLKIFHNHLDDMQEMGGRPPECLKHFPVPRALGQFLQ
jgi:beta-glucosidase/6-phospho-beta-glucosidase/beta-galactosidase